MTLSDLFTKVDILPGKKTTIGAVAQLAVVVAYGLEVINNEQFMVATAAVSSWFGVSLTAKAVRNAK